MSAIETHSPLYKVRRLLRLLRCAFGFPIQATNKSYTTFRFLPWLEYSRFVMLPSIVLLEYVCMVILLLIYDGNLNNIIKIKQACYNNFSTSKVDHIALNLVIIICLLSSLLYLFVFQYNSHLINQLCEGIYDLKINLSATSNKKNGGRNPTRFVVENATKTVIYGQMLCFISSILFGLWAYYIIQSIAYDGVLALYGIFFPLIFPFIYTVETYFRLFGPMACSVELLCGQIIDSLTDLFDDWIDTLKCESIDEKAKNNYNTNLQITLPNSVMDIKQEER